MLEPALRYYPQTNQATVEHKGLVEQVKLIRELDEKDKNTIFSIIDTMLTRKKFKDFFNKNIAAL